MGSNFDEVKDQLTRGVLHVAGSMGAFAAVKDDGSVVTWGDEEPGGDSDEIRDQLTCGGRHVVGNAFAFAAVKEDDSVVTL